MEKAGFHEEELKHQEALAVFKGWTDRVGVEVVRAQLEISGDVQSKELSGGIVIPDVDNDCHAVIDRERVSFRVGHWERCSLSLREAQATLEEVAAEISAA